MGKLGVSILSADLSHLADQVKLVEQHADLIHIDVMDAHFVPPLTLGPAVVGSLRPHTSLPLAGHLMIEQPDQLFDDFAEAGTDMVTFHLEALPDPAPAIRKATERGMLVGIALKLETPVEEVYPHLEHIQNVILMSIEPGWAGQLFRPETLPRIEALRAEIDRIGAELDVEIDGGITVETGRQCMEAGATVLTAASSIYQAPDPAEAARELAAVARGVA